MKLKNKNTSQLILAAIMLSLSSLSYADFGIRASAEKINDYTSTDIDKGLLLGLEYRGEKFNMSKGGASYDFSNTDKYAIEALLTSKNFGYEAKDDKAFKGMSRRHPSLDLGGRLIMDTGTVKTTINVTKDFNASKGYEAEIKLGGLSAHAPHWTGEREVTVAAAAGLRYRSKKVVDYYYGVKKSEATASRKAYKAKSALVPYVGIEAQANLTKHITLSGDLGVIKQADSIRDSPFTDDSNYESVVNVDFTYWF